MERSWAEQSGVLPAQAPRGGGAEALRRARGTSGCAPRWRKAREGEGRGAGAYGKHRRRVFFLCVFPSPEIRLKCAHESERKRGCVCSRGGRGGGAAERRSRGGAADPAPAGSRFFDDFRAAANAVCFALRSANPRAPWQAAALAALFALASRWRLKHINKAEASGEASVLSSLPLLE